MIQNHSRLPIDNILKQIAGLNTTGHKMFCDSLKFIFNDSIIKIIDRHNTPSIIILFRLEDKILLLKAEHGFPPITTLKEIEWYKQVKSKQSPEIIAFIVNDNIAAIILKYYEFAKTIDELAIDYNEPETIISEHINKNINYLDLLFNTNKHTKQGQGLRQSDHHLMGRYNERTERNQCCPELNRLLNLKSIVINDREYKGLNTYIQAIVNNKSVHDYLTPTRLGVIHGDLHCGNILVDKKIYYWIDPNGDLQMPLEYDYGKIFHSIHGGYGSIIRGKLCMNYLPTDRYNIVIDIPLAYQMAFDQFRNGISHDFFVRSLYAEAMHFASMLPHHQTNIFELRAIYLRCVMLFDDLWQQLDRAL